MCEGNLQESEGKVQLHLDFPDVLDAKLSKPGAAIARWPGLSLQYQEHLHMTVPFLESDEERTPTSQVPQERIRIR